MECRVESCKLIYSNCQVELAGSLHRLVLFSILQQMTRASVTDIFFFFMNATTSNLDTFFSSSLLMILVEYYFCHPSKTSCTHLKTKTAQPDMMSTSIFSRPHVPFC